MAQAEPGVVDLQGAPAAEPADLALPPEPAPGAHAVAEAAAAPARAVYRTTKKNEAVVVDGYVMIKHKLSGSGTVQHWRCECCNKHSCNARGESVAGTTYVVMRQKYNRHNHEPSGAALKVRTLSACCFDSRDNACLLGAQNSERSQGSGTASPDDSAATIVDHALNGADQDVVLAVSRENLLRVVTNARRLQGARQVNRPAVADIVFLDVFKTTAVGDQFLLVDSRTLAESPQSVFFIFSSPVQIRELRQRQHWAVDGTFYCTPSHFDSVFTIHVHVGHTSVPVAYFLLQDRTEATYRRALTAFLNAANLRFVQPASTMPDFELSAINALRATFPTAAIRLCLFHLAQSAFKNIAEYGLVHLYRDNARAQEILSCFPALAAVPPEDVVEGLNAIVDEINRMMANGDIDREWEATLADFEDYFERTYIRKLNRLVNGFDDPRYPVALWNHYHAILNNLHRTNNCWHHAFNNTFSTPHMALDKFVYRLKNDEDITRQRLLRHEFFPADPLRRRREKRYLEADKHLLALTRRYAAHYRAKGDILRYLRCVQHHLQKPRFPGEPADVDVDENVGDDEDRGNDNADGDGPEDNGDRIPRRESHPGDDHGFEAREEENGAPEAGGANGGAAEAAGARAVEVRVELLAGFSQADGVVNRQSSVHFGPVPLPSQSSSTAATSACVHRPPAAVVSPRGPGRLGTFNALRDNSNF